MSISRARKLVALFLKEAAEIIEEEDFAPAKETTGKCIKHSWEPYGIELNILRNREGFFCGTDGAIRRMFKGKYSPEQAYHLEIVSSYVKDARNVCQKLDELGISKQREPAELMKELYDIVVSYHPSVALN
jgi:hypothetical protein